MFNKFRKISCVAIALGALVVFSGCNSHSVDRSGPSYEASISKYRVDRRQLVRSAELELACYNVKKTVDSVKEAVKKNDGYFSQINVAENESAFMKIIVPAAKLDQTLTELKKCGTEVECNVYVCDVTRKIRDLDAALKNKMALRERLRALLKRAGKINEVLAVEKELTRLQIEIDNLEGSLRSYRKDVKESRISLEIRKHVVLGPLGYVFKGTYWIIKKLFVISS